MKHTLSLIFLLAAIWLALSGHFDTLLLSLGAVSVALTAFLSVRMAVVDRESHPIHLSRALIVYWPWLIWQIIKANLDVCRRILSRGNAISPTVVVVPVRQRSDLGRVIHANSITLTPGTVSLEVHADRIEVHALSREAAHEVQAGAMDARVPDAGVSE